MDCNNVSFNMFMWHKKGAKIEVFVRMVISLKV